MGRQRTGQNAPIGPPQRAIPKAGPQSGRHLQPDLLRDVQKATEAIKGAGIDAGRARLKIGPEEGDAQGLNAQCGDVGQVLFDFSNVEIAPQSGACLAREIADSEKHRQDKGRAL